MIIHTLKGEIIKGLGASEVLVIDGQIGVGKTTLGTILSERLNIPLFQEINKKQTLDLLDKFYSDPSKMGI